MDQLQRITMSIYLNSSFKVGDTLQSVNCGDFEVLEILGWSKVLIRFIKTGYETFAQSPHIKAGSVKDITHPSRFGIGYLGVGKYKFSEGGKATLTTVLWKSMLERCYCPKFQNKMPTYRGCSVCPEWHNFQIFAEWVESNYPTDGVTYQLDKDLLVKGNKVYSPTTCTFLTRQQNVEVSKAKHYVFIDPEGEVVKVYNISKFCKDKDLTRENIGKVHNGKRRSHKGWTKYIL